MNKQINPAFLSRKLFFSFGIITFLSVFLYGIGSLSQMEPVSPDMFIPQSLDSLPKPDSWLTVLSPLFVFLYACSFLPIVVMFSIVKFQTNPFTSVIAGCMLVVSFFVEIINALPMISFMILHKESVNISPEVMLYLRQTDAIRFLAYDVAGFTLAYMGLFVFALAFFKTNRWFSYLTIASTVFFIINVPFLWIWPTMAVILMALSIFAFSILPLMMVRIITKQFTTNRTHNVENLKE